jgi:hypothetical protein
MYAIPKRSRAMYPTALLVKSSVSAVFPEDAKARVGSKSHRTAVNGKRILGKLSIKTPLLMIAEIGTSYSI